MTHSTGRDQPASAAEHQDRASLAERYGLGTVTLRGVTLHAVTLGRAAGVILSELDAGRGGWVVTPNLDILRRASKESEAGTLVGQADLVLADGMPLVWASRIRGTPLPERVAGSTLVERLAAQAADRGRRVFLLGGDEGVAERAGRALTERYPGLVLAGTHCPPMGFENDEGEMGKIREAIARARPDLVYVGLGFPKQERLIRAVRGEAPGAWWLGVGISLSFLCGEVQRAPGWLQWIGLEWLHRLWQEPRRLFRRYVVHGLPFAGALLGGAVAERLKAEGGRRKTEDRNPRE